MIKNLAIISPVKPTYSETFIRAHIEQLPCTTHHFYSLPNRGYHPIYLPSGKALFSDSVLINYLETGTERLTGSLQLGYHFRKKQFRKYLLENKMDAVMVEYGPSGIMVMDDLEKLGIPLIVHFHGRDAYHYKTIDRYGKRYKRMFASAQSIIVVSHDMKKQIISLGCPADKIHISPCGPNPDFDLGVDVINSDPVFLSTGRFTAKKAPHITIGAFARGTEKIPSAKLIMLADGPLWEGSKLQVQQLGISSKVEFIGPQARSVIVRLMKEARAFVQHSIRAVDGDSEGTPVSILEAMLAGLPVISTRHAGIKDVVLESKTGLLTDEMDEAQMAMHFEKLATDVELAYELGRSGTERVRKYFTMEQHLDNVWAAINDTTRA